MCKYMLINIMKLWNEQFIISSNDLVNQLFNTRWFAEHHNVTNIFCKAVLKQITSQHMGVRSPPSCVRSWALRTLYHLEVTILTADEKSPTRGLQGQTALPPIYAGVRRVQGPERSGPHRGWGLVAPLLYKVICLSAGGKLKIFRMGIRCEFIRFPFQ